MSKKLNLAILWDKSEALSPSNEEAIEKFKFLGLKKGINCTVINRTYPANCLEKFDALFIRETTSTSFTNNARLFAVYAYGLDMPCIDDIESICRGSNKIFQFTMFSLKSIPTPQTKIISAYNYKNLDVNFPCVMKLNDSCFSMGVEKINNKKEFITACDNFLIEKSAKIILQDFIETDYDWRIIILDAKPLAAIKYYMVENDYRIIVHDLDGYRCGDFECVPIDKVPSEVINVSINACDCIGRGLYGVDLKEKDGSVYVIEVNDNPDIDAGIEDKLEGDKIYNNILDWFKRSI